jgi:hypothetical protein
MPEIPSWVIRRTEKGAANSNGHDDEPRRLEVGSADELDLLTLRPLEWIVEGLLPVGLALLVGKPKLGKSWLALDIGLACACGAPALFKVTTRRCAVLYLCLEDNERRLQSRMRTVLAGVPAPRDFRYSFECPPGMACLEAIEGHLDDHPDCKLVIIDPFAKVRGSPDGRKNAFQQDYSDIGAFQALANRRQIALLLVHHARKQDASDPMDSINGTTGISAATDTALILNRTRGEDVAQLSVTGRDIEDPRDLALSWERPLCRWKILGDAQTVRQETAQSRIFNYLREQQEPSSVNEIFGELQVNKWTVQTLLGRLRKRGAVERVGRGKWQVRRQ